MTCDKCQKEIPLGGWPWCPHERGVGRYHQDEVPGGFVVENGFEQPTRFYSHSEHRAALAARGLEIGAKWAGPLDKIMTRWDAPDATTLANATTLVSRTKAAPFAPDEAYEPIPITVTTIRFDKEAPHGT